jgi:integrase
LRDSAKNRAISGECTRCTNGAHTKAIGYTLPPGGLCVFPAQQFPWEQDLNLAASDITDASLLRFILRWPASFHFLHHNFSVGQYQSAKSRKFITSQSRDQIGKSGLQRRNTVATVKGLRDRAILAVLLGCGLRRSEVAALTFAHVQQRDGRWCIVDLVGKHGRVRTAPMPTWVKLAIDAWTSACAIADGHVFRAVNRADRVGSNRLGEKVVWQMLRQYALAVGIPSIAPHDLRSYAESRTKPN